MRLYVALAPSSCLSPAQLTSVAYTGVIYLDADFVGLGGSNLDVFDGQILAGLPGDGSLDENNY